jgi:hypothetical protein
MQNSSPSTAAASIDSTDLHKLTSAVASAFSGRGWTLAVAESCTGGLLAASLTDLAGSSQWFERGYVTYSNAAKVACLQVSPILIEAEQQLHQAGFRLDYLTVRRRSDLDNPQPADRELIILVAAYLGNTRLIDNLAVSR